MKFLFKSKKKRRVSKIERKTRETNIKIVLDLDGSGKYHIDTGIGFLNHMLELFVFHGKFDLNLKAKGDLDVDIHHVNEDIGLTLGEAFREALGDKNQIKRFGFYAPMDEALVRVVLDISSRPSLNIKTEIELKSLDGYEFFDFKHFLEGFAQKSGLNLHVDVFKGESMHHIFEAVFKALAKALKEAVKIDPDSSGVPSTKGKL
ncbi:MAG: imidazoleglycerol-phosphate dehydratase HisB [Candidatus Kaelpia aquatica]|nr:imidazoleglycerol-phosphate dehydratase HisB [Candidatus Kaelpia aquatica]